MTEPGRDAGHKHADGDRRGFTVSYDSVPRSKKNEFKPHLKKCWCIPPDHSAAFVAAMEDVLTVYSRPYDEDYPVVCMDEKPIQLFD